MIVAKKCLSTSSNRTTHLVWCVGLACAGLVALTPVESTAQVIKLPISKKLADSSKLPVPQLKQAIEKTSKQTASDLAKGIHLSDEGRVISLHVADRPIADVLRILSIQSHRNIIPSPNVQGNVTANLFDLSFEEALDAILKMNGAGYRMVDKFVYVYTEEELDKLDAKRHGSRTTRIFHLNYVSAADAVTMLEPWLSDEEDIIVSSPTTLTGVSSTPEDAGGMSYATSDFVIVTAHPATLLEVEKILHEIDIRPKQVLVEATILRANLSDNNALGIDFSIVGGVDLQQLNATSNGVLDVSVGQLPTERFEKFNAAAQTDFRSDVPDGGISIGVIKDKVGVFLRALEQVTDTTVIANPKVLALNKQKGQVIVGRRDGFLTTTVTQTQAIQTVKFLETGTQLIFRPIIGNDGFIRVELHPEDSVGFVNAQGLPSEQTTEVTTNVIMRDGDTILIGGLFREVTSETRNQVPLLGSIPVLGSLFQSKNDSAGREEVIILLTIHIVKDHAAFVDASMEQFEEIERNRIGIRQGLMWHSRTRLAQSHYRKAMQAFDTGDEAKALWYSDMALHSSSRFTPAMKLKERILGKKLWDDDSVDLHSFVRRLIAKQQQSTPMPDHPTPTTLTTPKTTPHEHTHTITPIKEDVTKHKDDVTKQ